SRRTFISRAIRNRETLPSILNAAGLKFDLVQVCGTTGSPSFEDDLERVIGEHAQVKDRWIVYFAPSAAQFVTPILENCFSLPRIDRSIEQWQQ
ncbi:hypothetical protein F5887DRAFT_896901, partial [Amanita rubescens]